MTKRVAIIGAAHRFPGTTSAENFWEALKEEKDLVTSVASDRWGKDAFLHPDKKHPGTSYTFAAGSLGDVSGFDASFFGISPREATSMDPQQRLLLEMSWEAMEDAGIPPETLRGSQCGVYMGVASADYSYRMADDMSAIDTSSATGNTASIAANRISYVFNFQGPSMSLDTACSSSLVAFHQACQSIRSGETDMALAGGISLHLHPYGFLVFSKASMLSPTGRCQVFDADGDGYVRSEGGGIFMLKDHEKAVRDGDRILAVVAASGINTDGHKSGLTVPNPDAQVALMTTTLAQAGMTPDDLDYLEAHGTGTAVGDPLETRAIGAAIGQKRSRPLPIGSVKSNLGHLETASGVAGLAKALQVIRHREVPATIGIKTVNPRIDTDGWNLDIVTQARALAPEGRLVIGINSFGFGGANAHVILESHTSTPESASKPNPTAPMPLPLRLSARDDDALRQQAQALSDQLSKSDASLYDLAYGLLYRREHHRNGALLFSDNATEAATALAQFAAGDMPDAVTTGQRVPAAQGPVFVYTGNGCQWETMGKELLSSSPVFATAVDEVDREFLRYADFSLRAELEGRNGDERLARTEIAQPALFALQVGVTRMLEDHGITPTKVTGHSVGEVAAAWASGALTLEDAVKVIYYRSTYQGHTQGSGEMTAVGLGATDIQPWLDDARFDGIVLAGINSPRGVTLAGAPDDLASLETALEEQRIFAKRLPLDYAFHSPAMDPIKGKVTEALADVTPGIATIPFISTVTGNEITGTQLDGLYWWHNIRQPVLFESAITDATQHGDNTFIEIGAHPILRRYIDDVLKDMSREGTVIPSVVRDQDDTLAMNQCLSKVLLSGVPTAMDTWFPVTGRHIDLPHYSWQREPYWYRPTGDSQGLMSRHYEHPLLGYRLAQQGLTWESQLDAKRLPWLADHRVGDGIVFPGAGYAELALAAAHAHKAQPLIDIESLEIHSPLLLDGPNGKRMRLCMDEADGTIRMQSREPASDDPWNLHASARLLRQSHGLSLTRQAPPLPDRVPDFDRDAHLAMASRIGLEYGPAFQAIGHGWVEGDDVIGVIDLPEAIRATFDDTQSAFLLHPGILDSAFQLFIPRLAREMQAAEGLAYVPVRLERLQIEVGDRIPALVQVRLTSRAPHSLCADVAIFDGQGQAIAVVQEARFKAVRLKRQASQRLSFLDHRLVAAPRNPLPAPPDASPFDASPLATSAPQMCQALAAAYQSHTGSHYASEVEPLLDSLVLAFTSEALAPLADPQGHLARGQLEQQAPHVRQLAEALLQLATDNGLADESAEGWQLAGTELDVDAATIWNLLIRDYPERTALTHRVGRLGRHLPALLDESRDLESLALPEALASQLIHQAIGDDGWHALAAYLSSQCKALLEALPSGGRLGLLEASAVSPRLAARLLPQLDSDRCDYHFLGLSPAAHSAAEALAERYPQLEYSSLDQPATRQANAQIALISLDSGLDNVLQLLDQLTGQLAPGARIMLVGTASTSWQQLLRLAQHPESQAPCSPTQAKALLASSGFTQIELQALEVADNGVQAVMAEWPGKPASEAESNAEHSTEHSAWLIVSGDAESGLGQAIASRLRANGHPVQYHQSDEASPSSLIESDPFDAVIDLRGLASSDQARRCRMATEWLQCLEANENSAALWLLTHDVGAGLDDARHEPVSTEHVAEDAALWGFGRSLSNEAGARSVRLLDVPMAAASSDPLLDALVHELSKPDDETEIVLDADGQRWVPRLGLVPAPEQQTVTMDDQALSLGFELPGQLRHLRWQSHALPAPGNGQVEVKVEATGLNFRDVMYALGLLSDEAIEHGFAGPTLGLEFAGRVVRTGANVSHLQPGDAVVGFGPASFSDRLIADTHALATIPEGIGFAAAATIPTTFFTVYYALKHLARLEPGERLLIHGAAGGVGLAAIQIGRWLGAEIYATVGSEEKRDFMELLGIHRLYDSRSLTFAEDILHDSEDGRGVDVVLNSLAGEAINQNLRVLAPFGRFLELGKRDFYENTKVGLRPFRNNLSYFGIDSDQLMREKPRLTQSLFEEMMALFADSTLSPLPFTAFNSNSVIDAFRYMQQARQIGKVVVTYEQPPTAEPAKASVGTLTLSESASYLVTGGLGGFGLRTAEWLADKGARQLILIGRRGPTTEEAKDGIARLEARGVRVYAVACDVTDRAALADLLAACRDRLGPLKGIVHAATVIDDGLIRNLDGERIANALAPKIDGARHLDLLTRDHSLDFFVLYSSATTLFGNPGQASYVAANHWLEGLAATRRRQGLAATCVRWGAIEDVGFLARHTDTRDALQERLGGHALLAEDALKVLEQMLLNDARSLGVLELDWPALARFLPTADAPRYRDIAKGADASDDNEGDEDLQQLLASLSPDELRETLIELLRKELAKILLVEEEKLDIYRSVYDMGFDSLMGVELMTALEGRLGIQIPVMVLSEASTLAKLAEYLMRKLQGEDHEQSDEQADAQAQLASLKAQHGVEDTAPTTQEVDA